MSQHAELLATLHRHVVEFIVVGGLAAVILEATRDERRSALKGEGPDR